MTQELTKVEVDRDMDEFINGFDTFDARIAKRNSPMYVKTSDRIALFAIYYRG